MTEMPGIVAAGDVSVVVCTYDSGRRPLLERGLEALKHQVQPAGAVIVVVDHNPQLLGALRADHPVRHGQETAAFIRAMGTWWGDLLTALREHAARG